MYIAVDGYKESYTLCRGHMRIIIIPNLGYQHDERYSFHDCPRQISGKYNLYKNLDEYTCISVHLY